ncbi:MAG TPA: MobH family relaxase [Pseudorhodoferax sp.]|nr:MobH family relaxase [Pseudorhodoferax sp.]
MATTEAFHETQAGTSAHPGLASQLGAAADFVYPSVDRGFPPLGLDQLLDAHQDLLGRIKLCYGRTKDSFDSDVMSLVRRYAALVHLLPATPTNYFNEPGGLLRIGLETAFYALQGTDAHIFSGRAPIATRRHLEPRWRLATFIAGLCAEIQRTLGQVVVTDRDGTEWPSYLQGLHPWLVEHGIYRYFLKWRPNAPQSPGLALFALPLVVPASTLQHLAQGNAVVVPHMLASLCGVHLAREHNILDELVRRAAALVIDRFLQTSADRFGKPMLGSHLERYLVDALRRLVATHPAWEPNGEKSRVWYGSDGLFIVWPNAATDIRKLLEADQLPGIPKAAETMLEILLGAGVLQARTSGEPLWCIQPPGAKSTFEAVKLMEPASMLSSLEQRPSPSADAMLAPAPPTGPAAPTPPSAPAPRPQAVAQPAAEGPPPAARTARIVDGPKNGPAISGQQLELPVSPLPEPDTCPTPLATPGATTCAQQADMSAQLSPEVLGPLRLEAPMRLAPHLRDTVSDIVLALGTAGQACCASLTPQGLFIALAEFERRHVEPSHALRGLSDARMLVAGAQGTTSAVRLEIDGQKHLGLLIAPAYLAGGEVTIEATASS